MSATYESGASARRGVSVMSADEVILAARVLLVALFIVFGWDKRIHYGTTVNLMAQRGLPLPTIIAAVVVAVELPLCVLLLLGACTRPLALVLALYTVGTAFIGHRFWELEGAARYANAINFYKNWSIVGGFLLLYVTGPGRYSVDAKVLHSRSDEVTP